MHEVCYLGSSSVTIMARLQAGWLWV